ncbi:fumarylacetoacetase [Sandaracinobacter sp. RS1-74]|uniref:fumarylacetoacetase n=1 Tax=Sandaracinobacteroides sayramensis TaxID=2913411 RepID=UPI001EDBD300|nr:fumarylacetoacetase [Sandaracinobacteroides sayramensis]MCG2842509.1 fumarylacetoacetase [Sandaracinobacteroides sayramensis]
MGWWTIDHTHEPNASSWVEGADGHPEFPVQNLPFGLFSNGFAAPRVGVAIGGFVFDLAGAARAGLFPDLPWLEDVAEERLNELLAMGEHARVALRHALFALLTDSARAETASAFLLPVAEVELHLPCDVGNYTDFYAGIHHATRIGKLFRPDNPLTPNYKHVPIGYHGRASSVVLSGTNIVRPQGQLPGTDGPRFGPSERLDLELELGVWIGPGNDLGHPVPIAEAHEQIAGFCLLNDWSARDVQAWEYQPLGPFLAKSFATSVSAWIVTPEALAPFRGPAFPRAAGEPRPLPYLRDEADERHGGLRLTLGVWLQTRAMREAGLPEVRLSGGSSEALYWTVQQMVAHHTVGGCNLRPGDLFGTGTISGEAQGSEGSLLELTEGGQKPVALPNGEERRFLLDGDRLRISARAQAPGFAAIGFGECVGEIIG